jgi:hypothetical protein
MMPNKNDQRAAERRLPPTTIIAQISAARADMPADLI